MAKAKLRDTLTAEQVRALLDYDPETGLFRWKPHIDHWRAGLPAGTRMVQTRGKYIVIGIKRVVLRAHRLAWLHHYGEWPATFVDHINGNGCDNRIANLRLADPSQNAQNSKRRNDNTSGYRGVSWSKRSNRWLAHISAEGKMYHLGLFDTAEEAHAAYCEAARRLHGEFARTA